MQPDIFGYIRDSPTGTKKNYMVFSLQVNCTDRVVADCQRS
jgi:hypothetical protein